MLGKSADADLDAAGYLVWDSFFGQPFAEHVTPMLLPTNPTRAKTTWLIDYIPIIEQGLVDLAAWVETRVAPAETTYAFVDGKVTLPRSASERGGVQPVVEVTANGTVRTEAKIGEPVTIVAHAEAPPGAGTCTSAQWDLDASGRFAVDASVAPGLSEPTLSHTHVFDKPGTYFVTGRTRLKRHGDRAARRQLENLASAGIMVTRRSCRGRPPADCPMHRRGLDALSRAKKVKGGPS
jgi:hypothetical protein